MICLSLAGFLGGCGDEDDDGPPTPAVTGPIDEKGSDLFVLRGPASVSDGRIEIEADVVEWFNDRPKHQAGVAKAEELVSSWESFGFEAEPPNAALSGEETDAEVELTKPEATSNGVSFAYEPIRGDVASEDGSMSVFIDSSEWDTDMHVYVNAQWNEICPGSEQFAELRDPVILTAPHDWSTAPPNEWVIPNGASGVAEQIFTAASSNGSTNFKVQYTLVCGDTDYRNTVVFQGSVPDNLFDSDSFSCSVDGGLACKHSEGGGYHVTANAELYNP